ncbi:beta-microseminoprotein-like [Pyxicephalus adspersus]|uniref:beta-microseminoprotein-like n=1 Tax=Pyxicephalus adspersus TaxID=30357 RepID=UPI003B5AEC67
MQPNYNSRSSPMVNVVALILVSGFLIMSCNAICNEYQPRRLRSGEKPTGCMDEDIMRELNSAWSTEDCMQCKCLPDGSINCCTKVNKPVLADPECEAILNKTTCDYIVKRKDNSNKPCLLRGVM